MVHKRPEEAKRLPCEVSGNPSLPLQDDRMSFNEARNTLKRLLAADESIIHHCEAVSKTAFDIAQKISENGIQVDVEFVRAAALLHDIGRAKSHVDHEVASGEILRAMGYPKIAQAVERHGGKGFWNAGLANMTLEEKIIFYADKLVDGEKTVSIRERYDGLIQRRTAAGRVVEVPLIKKEFELTQKLEAELNRLMRK